MQKPTDVTLRVIFSERAATRLAELGEYIAREATSAVANGYLDRIHAACMALTVFPKRGRRRDDILPGLRTIGFERRATIAYRVFDTHVEIISIAYGGRDFESELRKP